MPTLLEFRSGDGVEFTTQIMPLLPLVYLVATNLERPRSAWLCVVRASP